MRISGCYIIFRQSEHISVRKYGRNIAIWIEIDKKKEEFNNLPIIKRVPWFIPFRMTYCPIFYTECDVFGSVFSLRFVNTDSSSFFFYSISVFQIEWKETSCVCHRAYTKQSTPIAGELCNFFMDSRLLLLFFFFCVWTLSLLITFQNRYHLNLFAHVNYCYDLFTHSNNLLGFFFSLFLFDSSDTLKCYSKYIENCSIFEWFPNENETSHPKMKWTNQIEMSLIWVIAY